jgi:hypothetical protein
MHKNNRTKTQIPFQHLAQNLETHGHQSSTTGIRRQSSDQSANGLNHPAVNIKNKNIVMKGTELETGLKRKDKKEETRKKHLIRLITTHSSPKSQPCQFLEDAISSQSPLKQSTLPIYNKLIEILVKRKSKHK